MFGILLALFMGSSGEIEIALALSPLISLLTFGLGPGA